MRETEKPPGLVEAARPAARVRPRARRLPVIVTAPRCTAAGVAVGVPLGSLARGRSFRDGAGVEYIVEANLGDAVLVGGGHADPLLIVHPFRAVRG